MVEPQRFEEQIRWLASHADVLTPARFTRIQNGSERLLRDAVLVTIDDGHCSVATHALEVLDRYSISAVLFVCPALVDAQGAGQTGHPFMTWAQLERCLQGGHEVSSHGFTHRSLGRMTLAEAADEIARAKSLLATHLGVSSPFFAFPFGTRRDFSQPLVSLLHSHGYEFCFTSIHGACEPKHPTTWLPRLKVESGEGLRMFRHIVTGRMDSWRYIDNFAWPLQQRNRM
jgi:peptidoglycan/xylan/chitin deacetylase (PgdA/CDA1 family)